MGRQSQIDMRKNYGYTTNVPHTGRVGGETMKTFMKGAIRDEKGAGVLALVLVLLVVGGLILTPLLGLMSTGLLAGQAYERHTDRLYAADAGVEDAIWQIQTNNLTFGTNNWSEPWHLTANDKNVTIEVYREDMDLTPCVDDFTYQILSTARSADGGATKIDAHITTIINYYPSIMDQLITIQGDLTPQQVKDLEQDLGKLEITCPATCTDCLTWCKHAYNYSAYDKIPVGCRGCVAVYNFPQVAWPTVGSLNSTYWGDVKDAVPYGSDTLNVAEHPTIGPFLRDGPLNVLNDIADLTLKLDGTVYISGTTDMSPNKDTTLDLNGHTIFVASETAGTQLTIGGGKLTIKGPGLIVAVGDINFQPKAQVGTGPVFILSILGTTTVHPSGDIYGAIAGKVNVDLHQGSTPTTTYPAGGFNSTFPLIEASRTYGIASWEINPL